VCVTMYRVRDSGVSVTVYRMRNRGGSLPEYIVGLNSVSDSVDSGSNVCQ